VEQESTLLKKSKNFCLEKIKEGYKLKIILIGTEPEIDPRTHKISVSLKKHSHNFEILWPSIKIRKGGRFLSALLRYVGYMLQIAISNADIYWVANAPDIVMIPLFLLKRAYIYDFRSMWSKEVKAELGNGLLSSFAHIIEVLAMKNSRIIVLNTDTLFNDAKPFNKPLFLIPNYPLKDFKPTITSKIFRKINGVNKSSKIVLYVGRLSKVEGADIIPSLMKKLSRHKEIKLWIVGAGSLQDLMKKLEKKYPKNLKFFGWQKYKHIPNFINASDVCIVPRHRDHNSFYYNEKGVQKISEYMLYRKPIICSGIAPSNQYLLVEEENLFEGILKALKDKAPIPTPKTWEEHAEPELLRTLNSLKKSI
jgi:glycosyltransferase involved in cell wall biosynthesis